MDLKKVYTLDMKAKTVSTVDLPFDMSKYMPADSPVMKMMADVKVTVTPTTETKKIKDWNATKYTMTMTMPMGVDITQDMWVTKDLALERAGWQEMSRTLMSMAPGADKMAEEMKKIDGVPVLTERTQKMMGGMSMQSHEDLISVEQKEPVAGFYDVPKDFTEKAFNPMEDQGGMGGGPGRKNVGRAGGTPTEKPAEKPTPKPQPK